MKLKQLTSVLDFQGGSQPPKKDFESQPSKSNIRFLQIRDFKTDDKIVYIPISKKNRLCKKEDILIARYGASVGQILSGKEGAYNVALMKVIDKNELYKTKYLYYFFNSPYFQKNLLSRSERSAQAGFNKGDLSEIKIPVPSLQEQEKIVERLDKVFENIEKSITDIMKSQEYISKLFQSYTDSFFKNFNLTLLFENIIESQGTGIERRVNLQSLDKPFKYLKMNNITKDNQLILDDFTSIDAVQSEVNKYRLDSGDFLFNTRNSFELVGKSAVFRDSRLWLFNNNILRVKFQKQIFPEFINFFFTSNFCKNQLKNIKSGTTNVSAIYLKDLKKITLPDIPYEKQIQITEQIQLVSKKINSLNIIYENKLSSYESLKSSILNNSFKEKITEDAA